MIHVPVTVAAFFVTRRVARVVLSPRLSTLLVLSTLLWRVVLVRRPGACVVDSTATSSRDRLRALLLTGALIAAPDCGVLRLADDRAGGILFKVLR